MYGHATLNKPDPSGQKGGRGRAPGQLGGETFQEM